MRPRTLGRIFASPVGELFGNQLLWVSRRHNPVPIKEKNMEENKNTSVIENLLETVENGRLGFEEAAEKLADDGNSALAGEMRELSQQRVRMANELKALAASEGAPIEGGNGTVAGAMHRSYMAMKDALTGDDPHAVLAAAEQGEDHAVAEYERALDEDLAPAVKALVSAQYAEVQTAHDRVRSLRDSNE